MSKAFTSASQPGERAQRCKQCAHARTCSFNSARGAIPSICRQRSSSQHRRVPTHALTRRHSVLLSLTLPVLSAASSTAGPAHAAAAATQPTLKTFTSVDSKFAFDYPDTWAIAVVRALTLSARVSSYPWSAQRNRCVSVRDTRLAPHDKATQAEQAPRCRTATTCKCQAP